MAPEWVITLVFGIALLAWYLSFTASRLDRLHHRVESARLALDTQLVRRAEAAMEMATSGQLDAASGLLLADAAARALDAGDAIAIPDETSRSSLLTGHDDGGLGREQAESDLSRVIRATLRGPLFTIATADSVDRVRTTGQRVQLARRFLNGAVTDALRLRRKRVVRWSKLAGRADVPRTFEIDDALPEP
ncbi:MAG: hypothetical protein ACRCTR_05225 [Actinomycetota bacterium]